MSNNNNPIKVVLLGESGVGKTSIIQQFTCHTFDKDTLSSISSQYTSKTIEYEDLNKSLAFDIWDTAGQERYRALAKMYYKNAKIIVLVYDLTNKKSFDLIKSYWMEQLKLYTNRKAILALVSNKDDLYDIQQVSNEEGEKYADEINAIFQSTSAKSDHGITQLFDNLGRKILIPDFDYKAKNEKAKQDYELKKKKRKGDEDDEEEEENKGSIKLEKNENSFNDKKKTCCK